MGRAGQEDVKADACLIAAEQVQRKLMALAHKIDRMNDSSVSPNNPLPVDVFLGDMGTRRNAPRIVFEPRRLRDKLWTESVTAYIYAGIERAFTKAGLIPGDNRSGYACKLRELRVWVEEQERNLERKVPRHFAQKTALLFSKGILEERRRDRIGIISDIGHQIPPRRTDLAQLKTWVDEDLDDDRLRKKGRPTDYQKIAFAVEIANLWNTLTGKPISKGPETNFAQFVVACWNSGFVEVDVNSNFKRTIRHHIEESKEPYQCGRCDSCKQREKCERKRYYGILM